jgi:hypothetical protein
MMIAYAFIILLFWPAAYLFVTVYTLTHCHHALFGGMYGFTHR